MSTKNNRKAVSPVVADSGPSDQEGFAEWNLFCFQDTSWMDLIAVWWKVGAKQGKGWNLGRMLDYAGIKAQ